MTPEEYNRLLIEAVKVEEGPLQVFVPQWQYDEMKAKGLDVDPFEGAIKVVPFGPFKY